MGETFWIMGGLLWALLAALCLLDRRGRRGSDGRIRDGLATALSGGPLPPRPHSYPRTSAAAECLLLDHGPGDRTIVRCTHPHAARAAAAAVARSLSAAGRPTVERERLRGLLVRAGLYVARAAANRHDPGTWEALRLRREIEAALDAGLPGAKAA